MTVGCIRTTVTPPLASGIYEALLEKANRENAELADRLSGLELSTTQKLAQLEQERNEAIQERERWKMQAEQKWGMRRELEELLGVKDTQCDEQFAKGLAALRDLIKERDEVRVSLDRLATIASEAFGPFPVQSGEENLTAIETGIHGLRMDNDKLERERDEARALLERKWDKEDPPLVRMMRERDEAREENERLKNFADNVHAELLEAREESLEQARLLGKGGSREARLITERDHYKEAIEEISVTIQDWLDSIVQEPSLDFIKAIKAWADKKLNPAFISK